MEAPEKIYLRHNHKGDIGAGWLTFPLINNDIEYTRTDAFVEKAKKWFEKQNEWFGPNRNRHCDLNDFEDFRNYMKGE